MTDITIVGAGASGIVAAITAARAGKSVVLLEHKDKIGKKILATGNGKCNFTNQNMSLDHYNGALDLAEAVLKQFTFDDCLDWFAKIGVMARNKNGYYYPNSETALSMVQSLTLELQRLGVSIMTECQVISITDKRDQFEVKTSQKTFRTRKVIFACGLLANPKLGSDGSAFDIIKDFGHRFVPIVPSLCAFNCSGADFSKVSGVRTSATVALYVEGEFICSDTGELQLTDYGLSGIPVFQISSKTSRALYNKQKCCIKVDFMPDMSGEELFDYLVARRDSVMDKRNVYDFLNTMFNYKLISMLISQSNMDGKKPASDLSDKDIEKLVNTIKSTECKVKSARPMDFAQVCSGGIRTEDIDINTLESKLFDNLFFCGELLDVDGQCGGYNLQWAWASGYVAGMNAAR